MNFLFQYYRILLFLYFVSCYESKIVIHILHTSILRITPFIKLHHIVLLSDNPIKHVYTLDFTPINQSYTSTLLKMAFGNNVPGHVRLRYIKTNIENKEMIIQNWDAMNKVNEDSSVKLSKSVYNTIYNKEIKTIIDKSFKWLPYMNLYNHNCQHFSHYVKNISRPFSIGNT